MQPSQLIARDKIDGAYDELHVGVEALKGDLEFAYKRAKVLADMLGISVQESPRLTLPAKTCRISYGRRHWREVARRPDND